MEPILPRKSRGVPRVVDRRVLNGIFWVLRSGAPWADLPGRYGPHTICYNRFRRWTKAGFWDRVMDAVTEAHDGDVQMIDGTSVRVHHSAATLKKSHPDRCMGRSRGGLTTKIHAFTDRNGLPIRLSLSEGQTHDIKAAKDLLSALQPRQLVLADKAYDAAWLRAQIESQGAVPNIPNRSGKAWNSCFSGEPYKDRNLVERFFNKIKFFRRIATRYDKLGTTYLAMVKLAAIRIWLRQN
ncbi:MAG: IS5 family transposase [Magnetovibrionaceae bacterium]